MNKLFSIIILFFLNYSLLAQGDWSQRDSVNGPPRAACASFTLKDEGFVVGGIDVEEFKRKSYSYDLEQDDWDDELPLGGETGLGLERGSAVAFSVDGFAFVGLGTGSVPYFKDFWKFDDESNTWTQMADFPGTARHGAVAFALGHAGYVGTGRDAAGLTNDFYSYNYYLNEWDEIAEFEGVSRTEAVGFDMGSKGYVGTGKSSTLFLKDFWEYRPDLDQWKRLSDLPGSARMGAVGLGTFPAAYIGLGEDADYNYRNDFWEYNYYGDIWTQREDYPGGGRTQASGFIVDSRVFIGLGYDGVYHDDFYEYDRLLSVDENEFSQFNVYPNPAEKEFRISANTNLDKANFTFFTVDGKNVTSKLTRNSTGLSQISFELNSELQGILIVQIITEEGYELSKKIVLK